MKNIYIATITITLLFFSNLGNSQSTMHSSSDVELKKIIQTGDINIYIDPSFQFIKINNKSEDEVEFITIHSSNGKIILNAPYRYEDNKVDIEYLRKGSYGLILKLNNRMITKRFTIK